MTTCSVPGCEATGDLMARGFRCVAHRAPVPVPDPAQTAAAAYVRTDYPRQKPCRYGTSTTDPLGRDDWPLGANLRLPVKPKKEKAS